MTSQGVTIDLIWIALWIGTLGCWLAARNLPYVLALPVSLLKVAIPFVYFAWYFDGVWTFVDDEIYLLISSTMLDQGYGPLSGLFQEEGRDYLFLASQGIHMLYSWWNILAQWLFGQHYYSAVFMNVLLTFVAGNFLYGIARLSGFSRGYATGLLIFFLLHWDVIAWSSVFNLKDVAVMTLTIMSFYCLLQMYERMTVRGVLALAAVMFCIVWLRFYVPVLVFLAVALWLFQRGGGGRKKYLILGIAVIGGGVVVGLQGPEYIFGLLQTLNYQSAIYGVFHWVLTPQPWSIDSNYSFLLIPSVIHWVLLIPTFIGAVTLWRRSHAARLILTYLLILIVLYGLGNEDWHGPRQRVQVAFAIVWSQFHFIWRLMQSAALPHQILPRGKKQQVEAVN